MHTRMFVIFFIACRFLLNQKCQSSSQPELIRWERESRRRRNWEKPLIDTELSWEMCSNFVGLTDSHSQYKACLFITAQASSTAPHTHTHSHTIFHDSLCLQNIFMMHLGEFPWRIFTYSQIHLNLYVSIPGTPSKSVEKIYSFLLQKTAALNSGWFKYSKLHLIMADMLLFSFKWLNKRHIGKWGCTVNQNIIKIAPTSSK